MRDPIKRKESNKRYNNSEKHKSYMKEYHKEYKNTEKNKAYRKKYYKEHKATPAQRKKWRLAKYSLNLDQIDQMLIRQNHKCKMCGYPLTETKRGIDHNHKTDKVRGILCSRCNWGLACIEDKTFLENGLRYLKENDYENYCAIIDYLYVGCLCSDYKI